MEIVFILVEPARAANIGAAARALKTMGFDQLWLVNAGNIEPEAYWVAHESGELLDQARHFPDLASALADIDFSIATGARRRLERMITFCRTNAARRCSASNTASAAPRSCSVGKAPA